MNPTYQNLNGVRLCRSLREVSKYGVFSGPYFPIFSPNTRKYVFRHFSRRGYIRDKPFSTRPKFSEKLKITWAYLGVRNISFSKNLAYVLNG